VREGTSRFGLFPVRKIMGHLIRSGRGRARFHDLEQKVTDLRPIQRGDELGALFVWMSVTGNGDAGQIAGHGSLQSPAAVIKANALLCEHLLGLRHEYTCGS